MLGLLIPPKRTGGEPDKHIVIFERSLRFQRYIFKFHVSFAGLLNNSCDQQFECFDNAPGELAQRAGFYATLPRLRSSYAGGAWLKRIYIKRIGTPGFQPPWYSILERPLTTKHDLLPNLPKAHMIIESLPTFFFAFQSTNLFRVQNWSTNCHEEFDGGPWPVVLQKVNSSLVIWLLERPLDLYKSQFVKWTGSLLIQSHTCLGPVTGHSPLSNWLESLQSDHLPSMAFASHVVERKFQEAGAKVDDGSERNCWGWECKVNMIIWYGLAIYMWLKYTCFGRETEILARTWWVSSCRSEKWSLVPNDEWDQSFEDFLKLALSRNQDVLLLRTSSHQCA